MGEQTTRILLVEDEEAHGELARRAFESDGGQRGGGADPAG